jgi:small Trp-rich protein
VNPSVPHRRTGAEATTMPLVAIGTLLVVLKMLEVDPVSGWSWWWILAPFGLAVLWWAYSDSTGLTQRRAIQRMEAKKVARRERDIEALGMSVHGDRRKRAQRQAAASSAGRRADDGKGGGD